jgi:hypothetical protein
MKCTCGKHADWRVKHCPYCGEKFSNYDRWEAKNSMELQEHENLLNAPVYADTVSNEEYTKEVAAADWRVIERKWKSTKRILKARANAINKDLRDMEFSNFCEGTKMLYRGLRDGEVDLDNFGKGVKDDWVKMCSEIKYAWDEMCSGIKDAWRS